MTIAATSTDIQWWDFTLRAVASIIAIVGASIAVIKYLDEKRKANETAKVDSQKPFSAKQQEIYFDLLNATSLTANIIADPKNDILRAQAIQRFWVLFWGPLPVVANKDVAIAADAFSVALDDPMDFVSLRNASMDLARACRGALGTAWSIGLEQYDKSDASVARPIPSREEFYPESGRYSA